MVDCTEVLIVCQIIRKPIGFFYKNVGILQECRDFNWRMSDCEDLVGITYRG